MVHTFFLLNYIFSQGVVTSTLVDVQPGFKKELTDCVKILTKEIATAVVDYDKVNSTDRAFVNEMNLYFFQNLTKKPNFIQWNLDYDTSSGHP